VHWENHARCNPPTSSFRRRWLAKIPICRRPLHTFLAMIRTSKHRGRQDERTFRVRSEPENRASFGQSGNDWQFESGLAAALDPQTGCIACFHCDGVQGHLDGLDGGEGLGGREAGGGNKEQHSERRKAERLKHV
jgi:hypothetical protein